MSTSVGPAPSRGFLYENGLSLTLAVLFLAAFVGQVLTGHRVYDEHVQTLGGASVSLSSYLVSGHFVEATFENWESEFLQMGLFVLLTVKLRQKGSSESKKLEGDDEVDEDPREKANDPDAPWPVRRGGFVLAVYEHSLTLALFGIFLVTFFLHAAGGHAEENVERALRGASPQTFGAFLGSSAFWFQSLQNWQSELVSVLAIVVLSIYLRERGSSQSKPVAAPHHQTGE